ncbi:hypothetical protein V6N11_074679 [Hibiscus sabdariffa]|uniref:Uncharacterized protein n=1 Tax=Hibiscus sabdariffa TaxID=183260 RepID=A0ABR2R4R3_9ROSI
MVVVLSVCCNIRLMEPPTRAPVCRGQVVEDHTLLPPSYEFHRKTPPPRLPPHTRQRRKSSPYFFSFSYTRISNLADSKGSVVYQYDHSAVSEAQNITNIRCLKELASVAANTKNVVGKRIGSTILKLSLSRSNLRQANLLL